MASRVPELTATVGRSLPSKGIEALVEVITIGAVTVRIQLVAALAAAAPPPVWPLDESFERWILR